MAGLHSWKDRAQHKRDKRTRLQQENCADAFRHVLETVPVLCVFVVFSLRRCMFCPSASTLGDGAVYSMQTVGVINVMSSMIAYCLSA